MLITTKILLGMDINNYTKDQVINTYIEVMASKVEIYCNIKGIPANMEGIVAEMTAALYRKQYGDVSQASASVGKIKSETVGNHKIEYETGSTTTTSTSLTQDILNDHKMQLNPFRRIKFV